MKNTTEDFCNELCIFLSLKFGTYENHVIYLGIQGQLLKNITNRKISLFSLIESKSNLLISFLLNQSNPPYDKGWLIPQRYKLFPSQ